MNVFNPGSERRMYVLMGGILFVAIALVSAALTRTDMHKTTLYMLDVGQGDSALVVLPGGVKLLIDGGPSGERLLENLARVLPPQDTYIDLVMMTHPQQDHFGGFVDLLRKYRVGAFLGTLRSSSVPGYDALHAEIEKNEVPYVQLLEGDRLRIGETVLEVLNPSPATITAGELNDTALVVLLRSPDISALFTGDIGATIEERLVATYDLAVDVLKVSHHGSRFSSSKAFIGEARPLVALIGVGKNSYGHPTTQTLNRLTTVRAQILRTDLRGSIKLEAQAGVLRVFAEHKY